MDWPVAFTLFVLFGSIIAMTVLPVGPQMILFASLVVLLAAGIVTPEAAFTEGFGNKALVAIASLFIVAEGLRQTGAVHYFVQRLLGRPKSSYSAQARLMIPAAMLSAFMNNTPVVAILMPVVDDWAKKCGISVSKLLLPLSYATILGGMCTIIGTSTTLILNEMLGDEQGGRELAMFEIAWIGIPLAILGIIYLLFVSPVLLPERRAAKGTQVDPREYTVEMLIEPSSPLAGKTVEQAGLRNLPGAFLIEIDREGEIIQAVAPERHLAAGDRLIFVGVVDSVVDLQKIPGLTPATNQVFKIDGPRSERLLIEAVVSNTCPYLNMTIREAKFRTRYNAAVIAVSRNGERLSGKLGDIELYPGDTLLIEANPSFLQLQRNSRDFYLVSAVEDSTPPRHERAWMAQAILGFMILMVTLGGYDMSVAASVSALMMVIASCVRPQESQRCIDWSVLLTIGLGLGIGAALKSSDTDDFLSDSLLSVIGDRPWTAMSVMFGLTMLLSNIVTAKAAGVLVLPIALETAHDLGVSPMPFGVAVIVAAAACFATPIGFQTNLMVFGPGGYRYADFIRIGVPLSILIWLTSLTLIPVIWPF